MDTYEEEDMEDNEEKQDQEREGQGNMYDEENSEQPQSDIVMNP